MKKEGFTRPPVRNDSRPAGRAELIGETDYIQTGPAEKVRLGCPAHAVSDDTRDPRRAVHELAALYEKPTGQGMRIDSAGSGELIAGIKCPNSATVRRS